MLQIFKYILINASFEDGSKQLVEENKERKKQMSMENMWSGIQRFSLPSIWKRNTEEQSYGSPEGRQQTLQQKAAGERVHELNEWRLWLVDFLR